MRVLNFLHIDLLYKYLINKLYIEKSRIFRKESQQPKYFKVQTFLLNILTFDALRYVT